MNYPIYELDRPYQSEEMFRYLQEFPQHIVYTQYKRGQEMLSTHVYPRDGLSIEMRWRCLANRTFSRLSSMEKVLKMYKENAITLLDSRIVRFSARHSLSRQSSLDMSVRNKYYTRVLQRPEKQGYTEQEYRWLEHKVQEAGQIPDLFFRMLAEEVSNRIAFESFYQEWKKKENGSREL
ncbi:hypothetical protein [Ectobacillus ponti]|uniref:Uncharacterized protein n=1 Tax=Ectobacillus ponti TaxID=2961894 RepID=A0AA42BRI0_9BACI|nr:hypothetical protein [Ectobacillus ponti]MCP8970421.1 hypothetical protein [Ectobacillus ponti]